MKSLEDLLALGEMLDREPGKLSAEVEKLLKIRARDGKIRWLKANAAQRAFEEKKTEHNIVLKARQMGMTTWIAARFFLHTITHGGVLTVQVAHTQAAVQAIFQTVQRMWENLPAELRQGPLKRSRANAGQMIFPALDSEFRVWTAGDRNAGRGLSIQNLHCSEVSRWQGNAGETLAGLRAALAPGGELVLESTPNGAYGVFYDEWLAGEMTQHFFPWWMEPVYAGRRVREEEITSDEYALMTTHGLTPQQIGFRRSLKRIYGNLQSQEFAEDAESCFRSTGDCCFEIEAIERRLTEVDRVMEKRRDGALCIWWDAKPERQYLVAVDAAGGGERGDFAAVQVIDMATGAQCAELQQRLRPAELAGVAAELAREYGEALLVVERNNQGGTVLAYLRERERYTRLYEQGGEYGWLTTSASKAEMVAHLSVLLAQHPEMFQSRRLLGECRTFVSGERGKLSAAGSSHDDLVMAMAIGQQVRREVLVVPGKRKRSWAEKGLVVGVS